MSNIALNNGQAMLMQMAERNQDEWRNGGMTINEIHRLVGQILHNQQDLQFAARLQQAGMPAAERLMEVGQQVSPETCFHLDPAPNLISL